MRGIQDELSLCAAADIGSRDRTKRQYRNSIRYGIFYEDRFLFRGVVFYSPRSDLDDSVSHFVPSTRWTHEGASPKDFIHPTRPMNGRKELWTVVESSIMPLIFNFYAQTLGDLSGRYAFWSVR